MKKGSEIISKDTAYRIAEEYCISKGYDPEKLKTQVVRQFWGSASGYCFGQPTGVKPNGLCNDIATQPIGTLIVFSDGTVDESENARKYLA